MEESGDLSHRPPRRRVAFMTLGCKINQYDTSSMAAGVKEEGHDVVSDIELAEVIVINTCTVTGKTDYKGRQQIRRAIHENPHAVVIATGCYAQVQAARIGEIRGVDYVLGTAEKRMVPALVRSCRKQPSPQVRVGDVEQERRLEADALPVHSGTTRAFLKIQDGCDFACSYCIVPRARGRSRSLALEPLWNKIRTLADKGFQEVVLCGIHLGLYGQDLTPPTTLFELLTGLEANGPVPRVRISSVEPNEVKPELIALLAGARKICPHLHLPLQSGDSAILKAMNRSYTPADFAALVHALKSRMPQAAVGVDVIAGFPGETEEAFRSTLRFLENLPVSYFHVFPYSDRPETAASRLPSPVPPEKVHQRAEILRGLGREKRLAFYRGFVGAVVEIVVESKHDLQTGLQKGISRHYVPVLFRAGEDVQGKRVKVKVHRVEGTRVFGTLCESEQYGTPIDA